ncbi:helix-turn-helix domain-containing protein [Tunturiibacter empetritectus]|uniref:helix-turn-helix domain-containing protein n=1 Tax=Tunturiibacter empetritectus TaxID=3069691 RepID=UPI003D9BE45F
MDFSSRQLKAFHLVARHRSFARAAEELLITPSGLSVLIREPGATTRIPSVRPHDQTGHLDSFRR